MIENVYVFCYNAGTMFSSIRKKLRKSFLFKAVFATAFVAFFLCSNHLAPEHHLVTNAEKPLEASHTQNLQTCTDSKIFIQCRDDSDNLLTSETTTSDSSFVNFEEARTPQVRLNSRLSVTEKKAQENLYIIYNVLRV